MKRIALAVLTALLLTAPQPAEASVKSKLKAIACFPYFCARNVAVGLGVAALEAWAIAVELGH